MLSDTFGWAWMNLIVFCKKSYASPLVGNFPSSSDSSSEDSVAQTFLFWKIFSGVFNYRMLFNIGFNGKWLLKNSNYRAIFTWVNIQIAKSKTFLSNYRNFRIVGLRIIKSRLYLINFMNSVWSGERSVYSKDNQCIIEVYVTPRSSFLHRILDYKTPKFLEMKTE